MALGENSSASGDGSIALGGDSKATEDNTVSVGSGGSNPNYYPATRRIVNVSDGTADQDAATVGQVNSIVTVDKDATTQAATGTVTLTDATGIDSTQVYTKAKIDNMVSSGTLKGAKGDKGDQGIQGVKGDKGAGIVLNNADGTATIEDGTNSAMVYT
mgnify:CR=1 FL=1